MSGVETLVVTSTNADVAASIDLTNVTGLVTVDAQFTNNANADQIQIDGLAAGVKVTTTQTETADNLVLNLKDATGSADTISLQIDAIETANDVFNVDAAGIEVLNVNQKDAAASVNLDLAGVTATTGSKTTVNFTGVGGVVAKSMGSTIDTVIATGTGALTVAAADRANTAMTITGGQGADSIALEHTSDVLDGGAGTNDTLVVSLSAILGGISVDLGATDQIVSLNGGANSAAQSNFENVNLNAFTGFGAVVAGSTGANTIVGTALADQITGGNGIDTITGGGGIDSIVLTETTAVADTVRLTSAATADRDVITGFGATDVIALDESAFTTINFANTAAEAALAAADYNEIAAGGTIVADKVNVITTAAGYAGYTQAIAAITPAANAAELFLVFFNSTSGTTEVYWDADGDDADSGVLIAQLDITGANLATALSEANFAVF